MIGVVGYVPCLAPFEKCPPLPAWKATPSGAPLTPEFGLYYAFLPAFQKQGLATEAARGLVAYAFELLRLKRIVATTSYDNAASMGVMRRIGMRILRNPFPEPSWFQVVGVLENPQAIT